MHAGVVYPTIVRGRGEGEVFSALAAYRRLEQAPSQQLTRRQDHRLTDLLRHASQHSPFYRQFWPRLEWDDPRSVRKDLQELPLLSKGHLQENAEQIRIPSRTGRVTRKTTGGSTGQAVTVYKDRSATAREMAASWLAYGWFGVGIGDRAARFWGSPHTLKRRVRFMAADFAMHRVRFSAFAFNDRDLERYWQRCLRFRPRYLYGYVSMLEEFGRFLERRSYDGRLLGLKAVIATSEVLSPIQRAFLTDVFGAPVQNEYGCGEVGPIAYDCEYGKLHVMSDNVVVELLTADGRAARVGEVGEVVVTDLNNRAMPLVRYALGDFAVWGESCHCGRSFPVIDRIWGRAYDFLQAPSGRRYHGEFLMYVFEDFREKGMRIQQFQITQHAADAIDVALVLPDTSPDLLRRIEQALAMRLEGMHVAVRPVCSIARAPSGKAVIIQNPWLRQHAASTGEPVPHTPEDIPSDSAMAQAPRPLGRS